VSKLKFKYRRTFKEAEFAHADLEYHHEVVIDAKEEFRSEIGRLFDRLSPEVRNSLVNHREPQPKSRPEPAPMEGESADGSVPDLAPGLTPEEYEEQQEAQASHKSRSAESDELKKVFRQIASKTHPDKLATSKLSAREKTLRLKMFKKAKEAFNNQDWYTLHQIAIDLGISVPDPSEEQIEWLERDIKAVRGEISQLKNLTAWHWYQGDEDAKIAALRHYFKCTYNFDYPDL